MMKFQTGRRREDFALPNESLIWPASATWWLTMDCGAEAGCIRIQTPDLCYRFEVPALPLVESG